MTIGYISDLHIDSWVGEHCLNPEHKYFKMHIADFVDLRLEPKFCDVLIISGDLSHYNQLSTETLVQLSETCNHLLVTYGNHDMYIVSAGQEKQYRCDSMRKVNELKYALKPYPKIHFMDGDTIEIDGVKFFGFCGMWDASYAEKNYGWDMTKCVEDYPRYMNDAFYFMQDYKPHSRSLGYGASYFMTGFNIKAKVKEEFAKLSSVVEADIVFSHYGARVPNNLREDYKVPETTYYYFDGVTEIRRIGCKVAINGHSHDDVDEVEDGIRFLCNALGYASELSGNTIKYFEFKN